MASTTSLLRSAASTQKKVQSYQDSLVAFDWSNSAQTLSDFQDYAKYLNGRIASTTDPSAALTLTKTLVSANRSYVSNELQRQQMAIMEGRATTSDKMTAVSSLYQQAVNNGDYNLAQNMASQFDTLSIKLQNEQQAAQTAAATLAMNGVKTLDQLVKKATKGTDLLQMPDGTVIKPLGALNDELKANGQTSADYFGEVLRTVQAIQSVVASAYNGAQTQDVVDAIENKYGDIITGNKTFATAAGSLTPQDIELAYRSSLANNPLYSPQEVRNEATGALEYKLVKNKVDDFTWIRNADGTYQAVQTQAKVTSPYQTLDSKLTNEGFFLGESGKAGVSNIGNGQQVKTSSAASVKERLQQQGIIATQNSDGTISLILPTGEQVQGAIQPDGSVRYFGQPGQYSGGQAGMYEINVLNGQTREVAPDESSIFGQQSVFGGNLSQASDAGMKIIQSLAGVTKPTRGLLSPNAMITNPGINDFTGNGSPVNGTNLGGTTSGVLQNASMIQDRLQAQAEAKLQAQTLAQQTLQPSQAFNLNQTPVQQFAQNGQPIKQLQVAAPTPTPAVHVAAPTPTPVITSVGVAQPPQRITGVSVAAPQPRVVVQ